MKALKQYLEVREITQSEFAKTMGVSQPTVSGWLTGEILPAAQMLIKISNETGMSVDELLDHVPPRAARKSLSVRKAS